MRELLFPLKWAYQGATGFRNWLFDKNIRKAHVVGAKVISVGNLTVGGTGKTPVTLALLKLLAEKGYSAGVVTRGYKRQKKGLLKVELGANAATDFGDEPVLIKTSFPEAPVWVGEKKVAAARKLLETQPVTFLVLDDSFQHRSLHRDINLLLLDATEPMKNYRVMPVGLGRESIVPALRRVDFFVLTKTNLASNDELKDLIFWIKDKSDKPVLLAAYGFECFRSVTNKTEIALKDGAYLVTGVAKPDTVEKVIENRVKIVKHKTFDDHHRYTNLEVETMIDEASQLGARWIVTTAKDAVKLSPFHALRDRLWIIDMAIQFEGDLQAFYADIDRLARARD